MDPSVPVNPNGKRGDYEKVQNQIILGDDIVIKRIANLDGQVNRADYEA